MTVEHTRARKIKIKTAFTHQTNLNAIDAWINIPVNSYLLLILLFDCYINLRIYMHVIVVLNLYYYVLTPALQCREGLSLMLNINAFGVFLF